MQPAPPTHTTTTRPAAPQELVREETKVAEAAQTEAKAKQVAEAVETVVRAAREVETAKEEASGQAEKLAMAAQVGARLPWCCCLLPSKQSSTCPLAPD